MTTTALPVARSAKKPGKPFHVGNVQQPMTSPTPRGTTRNVFSIRIGSFFGAVPVRVMVPLMSPAVDGSTFEAPADAAGVVAAGFDPS